MPSDNKFMNLVYIYNISYYFFCFMPGDMKLLIDICGYLCNDIFDTSFYQYE